MSPRTRLLHFLSKAPRGGAAGSEKRRVSRRKLSKDSLLFADPRPGAQHDGSEFNRVDSKYLPHMQLGETKSRLRVTPPPQSHWPGVIVSIEAIKLS